LSGLPDHTAPLEEEVIFMDKNPKAVVVLFAALVAGVLLQQLVDAEASTLGLATVELALLATAVGAATRRALG